MKKINLYFSIDAPASEIYTALTNPFTIELWSGFPAKMDARPGGEFVFWEGDIFGKNLELVENEKIVQEWDFGDPNLQSVATFKLFPDSNEKTTIHVKHENVPDSLYENIIEGYKEVYFGAIKRFFEED